jgi:hypothetical protein
MHWICRRNNPARKETDKLEIVIRETFCPSFVTHLILLIFWFCITAFYIRNTHTLQRWPLYVHPLLHVEGILKYMHFRFFKPGTGNWLREWRYLCHPASTEFWRTYAATVTSYKQGAGTERRAELLVYCLGYVLELNHPPSTDIGENLFMTSKTDKTASVV